MNESNWPHGHQAAIAITMDNMGEAADLHRGTWPEHEPVGEHSSVREDLPRMLDTLGEYEIRATYFVEAWNTGVYPDAIRQVSDAGHEIAFHGWQHEPWSSLDPDTERQLFGKSMSGFSALDLSIDGFRPPGGVLGDQTRAMLREYGYGYCSPAGRDAAFDGEIVYLPFEWGGIDAYYYSEGFAGLREARGDTRDPLDPALLADRMTALIEQRVDQGGFTAILFHPFLENSPERIHAMRTVFDRVVRDDRIWCDTCTRIAEWVRNHAGMFPTDPQLDETTWAR